MRRYMLTRIGQIVITLFLFQVLLYVLLLSMPGDVTNRMIMNPDIPAAAREQMQEALGLNDPWYIQFGKWFGSFYTGDFGTSFLFSRPVTAVLAERIPRTLVLFAATTVVQFVVGFHTGRLLAWKRGGFFEYGLTVVSATLWTVFTPWFGLLMILIFSVELDWFPIGSFVTADIWSRADVPGLTLEAAGRASSKANFVFNRMLLTATIILVLYVLLVFLTRKMGSIQRRYTRLAGTALLLIVPIGWWWFFSGIGYLAWDIIYHMILPIFVLTAVGYAGTMLLMRTTMLDTLREDYIQTARAKGLPEHVVRDKHAARNALLPVFTGLVIGLPFLITGGVLTEEIFSWPGMGQLLILATTNEDIPLVMGTFTFVGILALAAHLVADVMYAFLDPRIRYK